jgi:hypothetical protein
MKELDEKTRRTWNQIHSLIVVAEDIWATDIGKSDDVHDDVHWALSKVFDALYDMREIERHEPYYKSNV